MTIPLDKDGYLINLSDWNEDVAADLAVKEGIDLSPAHWELIQLIRKFHERFEVSPAMRPLIKFAKQELGVEKATSLYFLKLFPGSPAKILAKISGLPRPENCL